MKRHLAKLKAAKASSHGSTAGASTASASTAATAKGASNDYLGYWSGAIPPFAVGWWFKIARAVGFVWNMS